MNILVFIKGSDIKLTKFLTLSEVECHCSYDTCTRTLVYDRTVKSFTKLRAEWGSPLIINSGFRCEVHNIDIGGSDGSFHKIGAALDIRPQGDYTVEMLDELEDLAYGFFDVVLRYDSFIHCHNKGNDRFAVTGEH